MSQDIVADGLNQIMNAKKVGNSFVIIKKHSKLLLALLEIAKREEYIKDYKTDGRNLEVNIGEINKCKAIKPRFNVTIKMIEKYVRRYLPARGFGIIIISTSQGLITHKEAYEKNIGGSLLAYFY